MCPRVESAEVHDDCWTTAAAIDDRTGTDFCRAVPYWYSVLTFSDCVCTMQATAMLSAIGYQRQQRQ